MPRRHAKPGVQPVYRNKPLLPHVDDSYKSRGKLPEPTLCPQCGAVFLKGKWQWLARPVTAHSETCPACHRIRDNFPAGYVRLEGEFLVQHRAEILGLVQHIEQREKAEHPLQRIMNIADEADAVLITTTDIHLARGIAEAIGNAFAGELDLQYNTEENLLRVTWKR
jgi:NMD protein affecting ribosome stability and mRNA decay